MGPIVYQVFVDRFAPPPADVPRRPGRGTRRMRRWDEQPRRGRRRQDGFWSHELDFWGGTLTGLRAKLPHIAGLGADVLYLNPIQASFTNHGYDPTSFLDVAPALGTSEDVTALADELHGRGMRLVLDGVFNHMSARAPAFEAACADPTSPWRRWFDIDARYAAGYRCWQDAASLPELCLADESVRAHLFEGPQSVVRTWLRRGADGWRLDVAHELGLANLAAIRSAARAEKPDAWVVGEAWNYPDGWLEALDGVLNFHGRHVVLAMLDGAISGARAGRLLEHMIADSGIEGLLRSWLVLDNHDTPRLATRLPRAADRQLAQVLQMTLPGAPVIYYGVEVGMTGGDDPTMRGPMRWDRVADGHPELRRLRGLLAMRGRLRALRVGDFRLLYSERVLAFARVTERVEDLVLVVVNASHEPVSELLSVRDHRLMNGSPMRDVLSHAELRVAAGCVEVALPARSARVFVACIPGRDGYSPYKRVD